MKRFLFLLPLLLAAGEINDATNATFEGEPHANIASCVNAITGQFYIKEADFTVSGFEPLSLPRIYHSRQRSSYLYPHLDLREEKKGRKGKRQLYVQEPTGGLLIYRQKNPEDRSLFVVDPKFLNKGVTNTGRGKIGARTNLRCNTIKYEDGVYYLKTGNGTVRTYARDHKPTKKISSTKRQTYHLTHERLSNGNHIDYQYDEKGRLIRMQSRNEKSTKIYAWATFTHQDDGSFQIETSDERTITYEFRNSRPVRIHHSDGPTEHITYEYGRINSRKLGENHQLKASYYYPDDENVKITQETDKRIGRVKNLKAPCGPGGALLSTHSFFYHISNHKTGNKFESHTDIVDSDGLKTTIQYGKCLEYQAITKFDKKQKPLFREHYIWGPGTYDDRLYCKLYEERGSPYCAQTYTYDGAGNVLAETLHGNLTGTCTAPILLSKHGVKNSGIETATTTYTYTKDGHNNIATETTPTSLTIENTYLKDTDLLIKRVTGNLTETYTYNEDYALTSYTETDGHHTRTTTYEPKQTAPALNYPEVIHEPHRHIHLTYNNRNQITSKTIYDNKDTYQYTLTYKYDPKGNLIRETDPLGNARTYTYDEYRNKTSETDEATGLTTTYTYDQMNRLTSVTADNRTTTYTYDSKSRITSTTDHRGLETTYTYDELDNITSAITPLSTTYATYNVQNKPLTQTDPNGNVTETTYNTRGQPTRILHPDGTETHITYNPSGTIAKETDREGLTTTYTYDTHSRPLTKTTNGLTTTYTYKGAHLHTETDPIGRITTHSYDAQGRRTAKKYCNQTTTYSYDTLSRLKTITTPTQKITYTYDHLNRITSETINGRTIAYTYDAHGNKTAITQTIDHRTCTQRHTYDHFDRLTSSTDPLGHTTQIHYNDRENTITTIDPLGRCHLQIYDLENHLIEEKRLDHNSNLLAHEHYDRDPNGNLTHQSSPLHPRTLHFAYDSNNHLKTLTDSNGTTRYTHTPTGNPLTILKPDETLISYTYDKHQRLKTLTAPNISYTYHYDKAHRPTRITDNETQTTTHRSYDTYDNITEETLANGLTLTSRYKNNQRTKLILPDGSPITYTYTRDQLKTISRPTYTHTYNTYDESNNPLTETLALGLGTLTHTYDQNGREVSQITPYTTETYNAYDPIGNLLSRTFNNQTFTYTYSHLNQLTSEPDHTYTYDSHQNRLSKDHQDYYFSNNQLKETPNATYTYDENGNPTQIEDTHFTYDALDRLIAVTTPTETYTYTYDAFHRRLTKNDTRYIYDGDNEIGAYENGRITELRILGLGRGAEIGAAVALELHGKIYIPIHTISGNVKCLLDPSTQTQIIIPYTAFGESPTILPWQFQSKRLDPETNLYYFGRRYYDPETGRFLTPDPKGYQSIPNLYHYVENNPLTLIDLYGLETVAPFFPIDRPKQEPFVYNGDGSLKPIEYRSFEDDLYAQRELKLTPGQKRNWHSKPFNLGRPEHPSGNKFITAINGMDTSYDRAYSNAHYVSDVSGGFNVHYIYNATHSRKTDLRECHIGLKGTATPPAFILRDQWREMIMRTGPDTRIFHISHSQGAIHSYHALCMLTPPERRCIEILSIAPAKTIPEQLCHRSSHYQSTNDFVPLLQNRYKPLDNFPKPEIIELTKHPEANFWDHDFQSPTFKTVIKEDAERFFGL